MEERKRKKERTGDTADHDGRGDSIKKIPEIMKKLTRKRV